MKKILLATTILGMTAGFAAAEIKFTGSAAAGFGQDGDMTVVNAQNDGNVHVYSSAELAVEFVGETDSGLTFGATFSATAGRSYTFADDEGFAAEGGSFGMPTVYISGSFGKVSFAADDMDFFDDANAGGDVQYSGSFGAVSVGLIVDVDAATNDPEASIKLGYSANNIALSLDADTYDIWNVSAAYTMGAVTATLATNEADVASLKLAYAANGISAAIKADTNDDWELDLGYAANGISVAIGTDQADAWEVTGSYDLGGGLSAEAGMNYADDMYVGAKMSF